MSNEEFDEINAVSNSYNYTHAFNLLESLDQLCDEEQAEAEAIPRRPRRFINRDREETAKRLWDDYFADEPRFHADMFRRRFRMSKSLFIRICQGIINYSVAPVPACFTYFHQKRDATGLLGFNVFQKCTSAIRQLAYSTTPDALDEYLHKKNKRIDKKKYAHPLPI